MKKRLFTAKQMRWWLAALLLTALFGGLGQIQVILANGYYPTATPMITATYTPTATATRVLEACQVTAVIFDQETYTQGDVMEITVRVANALGNPLAGAKVVADVTRRDLDEVEAEATTGFGLIDRTGDYDGTYAQTDLAGYYDFKFTVSDPTGERFLPCMGTATKTVSPKPTVEPTVEPTIEPTVEPTTEPTVEPTVEPTTEPTVEPTVEPTTEPTIEPTTEPTVEPPLTLIEVAPDSIGTTLCRLQETVAVNVGNVTDLLSVELEISYDPTVIQVIDGDGGQRGVQVRVGNIFSTGNITRNEVDTSNGLIHFSATRLSGYSQSIPDGLIAIDWRPQRVGSSAITLERVVLTDTNGQEIPSGISNGEIIVNFVPNCNVAGSVALQGRTDFDGVLVTNSAGIQTETAADGAFVLKADQVLNFTFPGYLSTQIDLSNPVEIVEADGQIVHVGDIELLAGDINGDDVINIFDLVQVAQLYQSDDISADINGDGLVNILDLAIIAGNFQQAGPIAAWQ